MIFINFSLCFAVFCIFLGISEHLREVLKYLSVLYHVANALFIELAADAVVLFLIS